METNEAVTHLSVPTALLALATAGIKARAWQGGSTQRIYLGAEKDGYIKVDEDGDVDIADTAISSSIGSSRMRGKVHAALRAEAVRK